MATTVPPTRRFRGLRRVGARRDHLSSPGCSFHRVVPSDFQWSFDYCTGIGHVLGEAWAMPEPPSVGNRSAHGGIAGEVRYDLAHVSLLPFLHCSAANSRSASRSPRCIGLVTFGGAADVRNRGFHMA